MSQVCPRLLKVNAQGSWASYEGERPIHAFLICKGPHWFCPSLWGATTRAVCFVHRMYVMLLLLTTLLLNEWTYGGLFLETFFIFFRHIEQTKALLLTARRPQRFLSRMFVCAYPRYVAWTEACPLPSRGKRKPRIGLRRREEGVKCCLTPRPL